MPKTASLIALVVLTVAAVAAVLLLEEDTGAIPEAGEPLFPGLLQRVNDAATIEVEAGGERFTIARREGRWVVQEREGHPAAADKVHQLLVGMAGLVRLEPKTAKPELYEKIGLVEPGDPEANSRRFVVRDGAGGMLASLLVGKSQPARGDPQLDEFFVRVGDERQSWLVQGRLPSGRKVTDWLDRVVLKIDRERVARVRVRHPDGETLTVTRDDVAEDRYALQGVPEGHRVESQWKVDDIGRGLTDLELDDVRRAGDPPDGAEPGYTVTLGTRDGLAVEMRTWRVGEGDDRETYARLTARFDPALVDRALLEEAKSAAKKGDAEQPAESTDSPEARKARKRAEALAKLRDEAAVRAEADELNTRWKDWLYRLPGFKADYFASRMADIAKAPEPEKAPGSSAPAGSPPSAPGGGASPSTPSG